MCVGEGVWRGVMNLLAIQMDTCSATISQKASQVEENRTAETQAKVRVGGM